jgi:hypothetical protein
MYESQFKFSYDDMETRWRLMHNGVEIDLYESASLLNAKLIRIDELEATVDYMERSHNKIVGLILNIDELEQDTDEMSEAQQDLLAIAQNSAVYGVPPKYRDISGRKRIDELELQLKQTVDNAISQASVLHTRINELEIKLANADHLIIELEQHEGAEGWSDYLRVALDAYALESQK